MMQEHCIYAKCFDILDEAQGKISPEKPKVADKGTWMEGRSWMP